MDWIDKVVQHLPLQQNKWAYGTAGFRGLASRMNSVCYRAALVALMRATQTGKNTGCMLTASHNHKDDNGLKLIDWNGEMLAGEWESIAEEFVNSDNLANTLKERFESSPNGTVYIACDNRPSSPSLISIIQQAIENAGGQVVNYGELTTPQLHYLVYLSNKTSSTPSEIEYTQHFSTHFETLINAPPLQTTGLYQPGLILDCSGGVGASKIPAFSSFLNLTLRNTDKHMLNEGCGAEHVQKTQTLPLNFTGQEPKCASFDGDADRLVYFKGSSIFGGDKLMALYLRALYGLFAREGVDAEIGVVTTGYSNSSAIEYLRSMATVFITPTGVKYLHEKAKEYEVGFYFEANGHGTILVKPHVLERCLAQNAKYSYSFLSLANPTVGDAITDLLLVEASLRLLDWDLDEWGNVYSELPSYNLKVPSSNKTALKTVWDETVVIEPIEFKNELENLLGKYKSYKGKCLVRASGTEDVIRILTEATTRDIAIELAEHVKEFIIRYIG